MRRPRLFVVSFSMRRPPSGVIVKTTTGRPAPCELSIEARASEM